MFTNLLYKNLGEIIFKYNSKTLFFNGENILNAVETNISVVRDPIYKHHSRHFSRRKVEEAFSVVLF